MLLQQIVGALDSELERLQTLRSIVSSLQSTFSVEFGEAQPLQEERSLPSTAAVQNVPETSTTTVAKRRRSGVAVKTPVRTAATRAMKEAKEARALSSTIPSGPVVVMPAALAREHAARREGQLRQPEPKPEKGSLGSMIRALHLDATA